MAVAVPHRLSAAVVAVCLLAAACGGCEAEAQSQGKPILTYFDFKGRAEPIRLAFHVGGIDFEDVRIGFERFREVKGQFPLGQLPVMQLGDKKYAESLAILVYAGRLGGLMPNNALAELEVNQILNALQDVVAISIRVFHETNEEKRKKMGQTLVHETLPRHFRAINGMVRGGPDGFAVGEQLTVADIGVYCVMDLMIEAGAGSGVLPNFFSGPDYQNLRKIHEVVADNAKVKEWEALHNKAK